MTYGRKRVLASEWTGKLQKILENQPRTREFRGRVSQKRATYARRAGVDWEGGVGTMENFAIERSIGLGEVFLPRIFEILGRRARN